MDEAEDTAERHAPELGPDAAKARLARQADRVLSTGGTGLGDLARDPRELLPAATH